MSRRIVLLGTLLAATIAHGDVAQIAKCQRKIATEGAKFAMRTIQATLKCTDEVSECQIQCEKGTYGPPCSSNPPPCCDPDDVDSNATFKQCMDLAQIFCNGQTRRIATYEATKQAKIIASCGLLTQDELCGAQQEGLNFATLNAGCQALDPSYTCNLTNLVACVGGPLERQLIDQISATLSPRASDAVTALHLQPAFPDIPVSMKVRGTVAAGKADVYQFTGKAGDQILVRVQTGDDTGSDGSLLHPGVTLFRQDGVSTVGNVNIKDIVCGVPNACGSP